MPSTITGFTTFVANTKARAEQVNDNFSNFRGTILPIDTDTATSSDVEHDLGTTEHRFKAAHVQVGYFQPGDVKYHHSFNGDVSAGGGWMVADGRQVTIANYEAEHGANTWAAHIGSSVGASPLANKYLPGMIDRYLVGITATTQDGSSSITAVGATSNAIDIRHNHQWYRHYGISDDVTYDTGGSEKSLDTTNNMSTGHSYIAVPTGPAIGMANEHSYTNNYGSSATSVQPDSIEAIPYIRII